VNCDQSPVFENDFELVWRFTGQLLQANHYLILNKETDTFIAIDSGFGRSLMTDFLLERRRKLSVVYLTHGHFDHSGGAANLAQINLCPVVMSKADDRTLKGSNFLLKMFGYGEKLVLPEVTLVDENFCDNGIRFYSCPGHTPGSVLIRTRSLVFTGDSVYADRIDAIKLPGQDDDLLREGIIRNLPILESAERIFPGHGIEVPGNYLLRRNPELAQFIHSAA